MDQYPIRPLIFKPIIRWGIVDKDRLPVLVLSAIGYFVPSRLKLLVYGFPAKYLICFLVLSLSLAFFSYCRLRKRPDWLLHRVKSLLKPDYLRGMEPTDPKSPWIV